MPTPSPRPTSPKAFISHSTKDRPFVEKLVADLNAEGIKTWYSGWDIKPGDRFPEEINRGLEWCDYFIIILSSSSMSRPWVETELYAALVRQQKGKIRRIIPVKIEEYGSLPAIFEPLLEADFSGQRYEAAKQQVIESILAVNPPTPVVQLKSSTVEPVLGSTRSSWIAICLIVMTLALSALFIHGAKNTTLFSFVIQGAVLGAIVWVFFAGVDNVLTAVTKLEISGWLVALRTAGKIQQWPDTFAKVFDQVFGEDHFAVRCFRRSCTVSFCGVALMFAVWGFGSPLRLIDYFRLNPHPVIEFLPSFLFISAIPDYISLLKSRAIIRIMSDRKGFLIPLFIILDVYLTLVIAVGAYVVYEVLGNKVFWLSYENMQRDLQILYEWPTLNSRKGQAPLSAILYPSLFTTVWVTLYGFAGLLLKFARRFDIGFDWFNRKFDIEKKPLQAIGLVAGALVAVVYWTAVIVGKVLGRSA
jgi:hypothetical protein